MLISVETYLVTRRRSIAFAGALRWHLAVMLGVVHMLAGAVLLRHQRCEDGGLRDVWECMYQMVVMSMGGYGRGLSRIGKLRKQANREIFAG